MNEMNELTKSKESPGDDAFWTAVGRDWRGTGVEREQGRWAGTAESNTRVQSLVRRQSRRMVLVMALEFAVCVAALGYSWWLVFSAAAGSPLEVVTGICLATLVVCSAGFGFWNRRGLWQSGSLETSEFVALLERRAVRRIQYLWFSMGLLVVEFLGFALWIALQPDMQRVQSYTFLVVWCGAAAVISVWLLRRAHREQRDALQLRDLVIMD